MTADDAVLGDDGSRLLDVLLEEEFRAASKPLAGVVSAPRLGRPRVLWLAALLGVAVVVATAWRAAARGAPAAGQDPDPPLRAVPFDPTLLPNVVGIRLRYARVINASGTGVEDPAPLRLHIRAADVVAAWRKALTGSLAATHMQRASCYAIELDLGNGTMLAGRANADGTFRFDGLGFTANAELEGLLDDALQQARRQQLRARGIATTVAEVAELDADRRTIVVPWLTADEARALLPRFRRLESIEFAPMATRTPSPVRVETRELAGNDLVLALAEIPTLCDLTVLGGHLHGDALRALARLPRLRALGLAGSPAAMPPDALGELVRRLEVLRVPDGDLTAEQLRAVGRAPDLRELWLHVDRPTAAVADCLRALPRLQRLSITGGARTELGELLTAIAQTRVVELELRHGVMAPDGIAALAGLPSLRTLALWYVLTPDGDVADLSPLRLLQHLRLPNEHNALDAARAALPGCMVHGDDPADPWVSPFDGAPR